MYDIAIVGAGPAGATAARLLSRHYRVFLADRRRLDLEPSANTPVKPCGGLLAPAAQRELARQGLGVPPNVVVGPQLFAVRTVDLATRAEQLYQRFYVNVDREAFDRWLVSLVPDRVDACFGWSLDELVLDDDAPSLSFRTAEGGRAGVRAKLVIGADGANSTVRRLAYGAHSRPRRYVAVQAAFEGIRTDPYYGALFDSSLTDFYGWTIPKGGALYVGMAFPAASSVRARYDTFISRMRDADFRFGSELSRTAASLARPDRPSHLFPGTGRVLLTGEAAGFISPSSAEGISYALRSAAHLAGAARTGLDHVDRRYTSAVRPLALKVGAKAFKGAVIYQPAVRRFLMRSGMGAIPARDAAAWTGALDGAAS